MSQIEHTVSDDLITWDSGSGVCKLIRVPREEIDDDSDEPDAWDLLWIEASSNLRRFEVRLDPAYGRGVAFADRATVRHFMATAPEEAIEILKHWTEET